MPQTGHHLIIGNRFRQFLTRLRSFPTATAAAVTGTAAGARQAAAATFLTAVADGSASLGSGLLTLMGRFRLAAAAAALAAWQPHAGQHFLQRHGI